MFAHAFFRLKIGRFKATRTVHRVAHPYIKNKILNLADFAITRISIRIFFVAFVALYQSPICQCLRTSFYANCHNFITSHFSWTILPRTAKFAVIRGRVLADHGKRCPTCHSGKQTSIFTIKNCNNINSCYGYGSQCCWIRIFLVRSGYFKKLWKYCAGFVRQKKGGGRFHLSSIFRLKGQCHEIFDPQFFSSIDPP
jgi:hypothetical protein